MSLSVDAVLGLLGEGPGETGAWEEPATLVIGRLLLPPVEPAIAVIAVYVPFLGREYIEDSGYRKAYQELLAASEAYALVRPDDAKDAEHWQRDFLFSHIRRHHDAELASDPFSDAADFTYSPVWCRLFLEEHFEEIKDLFLCPDAVSDYIYEASRLFPGGDGARLDPGRYTEAGRRRAQEAREARINGLVGSSLKRVEEQGAGWLWDEDNNPPQWVNSRRQVGRKGAKRWKDSIHAFSASGDCDPVYLSDGRIDEMASGCEYKKFHRNVPCAHELAFTQEMERRANGRGERASGAAGTGGEPDDGA